MLLDPVTAPQMPNGDLAMGLPLNSVAFGVAWTLQVVGTAIATKAT